MTDNDLHRRQLNGQQRDPSALSRLLSDTDWAVVWIAPRLYVGWVLLNVGWPLTKSAEWMESGFALRAGLAPAGGSEPWSWAGAGVQSGATSLLLQSGAVDWVARLTAIGITVAGIALILGLMSGLAAFTGIVLSANVLIAGSAEPGPIVLGMAVLLAMGWKTAGWIGLDRWVLPAVGAPWNGGSLTTASHVFEAPTSTVEASE